MKPVFNVGGRLVNASGQEVDKHGNLLSDMQAAEPDAGLQGRLEELQRELDEVRAAAVRKAQDADRLVQQWHEQAKLHGDRATDLEAKLDAASQALNRAKSENVSLQTNMDNTQKGYADYHAETQEQLAALTTERDSLKKQLADSKLIPEDALARLEGVKGIGKDLAQKGLDALTAPAKEGK